MARPFWSGQFQLSLVSFGIQLFPATEAKSEIRFHQLDRKTGERIRHQNVTSDEEPLQKDQIVKGYEYSKGEYVVIEPGEIENLRIPSRQTLAIEQFVDRSELDPKFFEKPYFVTPGNPAQAEAFSVIRKAMQSSGKVALGKIAFGGREHLVAISAPVDDRQLGMMAYTMRYAEELRNSEEYFEDIKPVAIDPDQLALAQELIKRKAAPFKPERFADEYEAAVRAMIDAKVKHVPTPRLAPAAKQAKVVNLMDALRKSVQGEKLPAARPQKKPPVSAKSDNAAGRVNGLALVNGASTAKTAKSKRKSA